MYKTVLLVIALAAAAYADTSAVVNTVTPQVVKGAVLASPAAYHQYPYQSYHPYQYQQAAYPVGYAYNTYPSTYYPSGYAASVPYGYVGHTGYPYAQQYYNQKYVGVPASSAYVF